MLNVEDKRQLLTGDSRDERKRLGQFFTGPKLARLLITIANPVRAQSVLDPMCGTGDMLRAAAEFNPKFDLTGVEIDAQVLEFARNKLASTPRLNLIRGNAFASNTLQRLGARHFDLVITNPPYVRYQSLANIMEDSEPLSASSIRQESLRAADFLLADPKDRSLFSEIIRSYSGLSDLAVPSWILAAMLTKVGGTLALVVPESWLSRDYAQIIQYLLLRWFRIRYVVEDANASWFPGTLVKTTLLVADRVARRPSAFSWQDEVYAHAHISCDAGNEASVVGNIFPNDPFPEKALAEQLETLLRRRQPMESTLWSVQPVRLSEKADNVKNAIGHRRWFRNCEQPSHRAINAAVIPVELRRWMGDEGKRDLTTLEQMGVAVGQGLRTGANRFFYVNLIKENDAFAEVAPNRDLGLEIATVPLDCLRPVLHRQSELPDGYRIDKSSLEVRVLMLKEDKLAGDLEGLIRIGQRTKVRGKFIPELSAVRTNIRPNGANANPVSGWYILPPLAPRHTPVLLVPRVNAQLPRTYLNAAGVVIDANFSTFWLKHTSIFTPMSLLAFLNSSWSVACMELLGSVMGGGALKLEATHLKKMPLPRFNPAHIRNLDRLGRALVESEGPYIIERIDEMIVDTFFEKGAVEDKLRELRAIVQSRLARRIKRV